MSSGGSRGGTGARRGPRPGSRGGRSSRGGRGGAAQASAQDSAAGSSTSGANLPAEGVSTELRSNPNLPSNAPSSAAPVLRATAGRSVDRALTVDSAQSSTPSPAPTTRGRFKPRAIRRTEAERKRLEEERERELDGKIKTEQQEQRMAERRSRRGRGRGDLSQRGGAVRRTVMGLGPFSAIQSDSIKQGQGWARAPGASSYYKTEDNPRYVDMRANEQRINSEYIQQYYAQENEGKDSESFWPVSIPRVEHKDPEVKIATSAELEAEEKDDGYEDEEEGGSKDGDMFVGEEVDPTPAAIKDDFKEWHAAPKSTKIKAEPGTEEADVMEIDSIPATTRDPSAELPKKPSNGRKKKIDVEDQTMLEDAQALLQILDLAPRPEGAATPAADGGPKPPDGQLYVFQFPPVMPPLRAPATDDDDVVELGGTQSGASKTGQSAGSNQAAMNGGVVGKLNVRRSGKVELDWGGQIFDLGLGTELGFPTSAIMVDETRAVGMGDIYGKFVAVPRFSEEEEWDPSPEDMEGLV